jgi:phospholipid/cholesterol/gamma-HCH transport system substrate-binding protein
MRDDFYNHLQSFMHKTETLMDDVNHYGLLFHLDKKWQRVRARRANLMNQLCTPQEFHNFFNDEINQVITALARVSSVLDEASCAPTCDEVFNSCKFSRVFADLLRRVNSLEGNLKLYSSQVEDSKEECCHSCNGCGWSQ